MRWTIPVILAVFLACRASSHTWHFGRTCPNVQPFPNLEVDKLLGKWYVLHKTDTDNDCLVWEVSRRNMPDSLQLKETRQLSVLDTFGVNHTHAVTANIDISNPEVPGKMRIRWPTSITGKADFIVFDTDYDNYFAVFECDRAAILHRRSTAILSKTPTMDEMSVKKVRRLLEVADVSSYYLSEINHNACRKSGETNWHIDREFFGLLPGGSEAEVIPGKPVNFQDYDPSQLEIIEDVNTSPFHGSYREGKPSV